TWNANAPVRPRPGTKCPATPTSTTSVTARPWACASAAATRTRSGGAATDPRRSPGTGIRVAARPHAPGHLQRVAGQAAAVDVVDRLGQAGEGARADVFVVHDPDV